MVGNMRTFVTDGQTDRQTDGQTIPFRRRLAHQKSEKSNGGKYENFCYGLTD